MRPAPAGRKKEAGGPLLTAQTGGAPFLAFFARSGPLHCQQSGRPLLEHREKRGTPVQLFPTDNESCGGRTRDAAKDGGADCGLSTITFRPIIRFG